MSRRVLAAMSLLLPLALLPGRAAADRRYFVDTYTPYLAPAGELELEVWTTARNGRGDSTNTAWQNRAEFEYAISDRLTGAFYLNFVQAEDAGAAQRFDGPSLELIYRLAEHGRIPLDPAFYLEARANGDELELEPKLLLAHRHGPLVAAMNLIGEFEFVRDAATEKSLALASGVSREFGPRVALGLEGLYRRGFVATGADPGALMVGPTLNLQAEKIQLAIGWHPQVWGSPSTGRHLNLADFERSEVRVVLGVDL